MKTSFIMLALVAAPFSASASVVMPLGQKLPAPIVVPETPNEVSPEALEEPTPEAGTPASPDADLEAEPETNQYLDPFPPLLDAGEDVMTAPSDGPLNADRL